ncbi:MAG TPA: tetratricopeptide repeat protein [Candidatus Angelobacter sp.]|nr:tetratricopeptide repeat protein [Candidatus Angelobacter sp.]
MKLNPVTSRLAALAIAVVLAMFASQLIWAQQVAVLVDGQVTEEGKPKGKVELVLTDPNTGRTYKTKTDKDGRFQIAGVQYGVYKIEVIDGGKVVFREQSNISTDKSTGTNTLSIDYSPSNPPPPEEKGGKEASKSKPPKMSKEQIKAEQEKVAKMNTLLQQAQVDMQTQKWTDAETALKQVIADNPDTTKWELYKALGDSQKNAGKEQDAAQTYNKGIQVAEAVATGKAPQDPRNPNPDPGRAKAGAAQMATSEGNIYVKMNKTDEAIVAYKKATEIDPSSATAFYNLCAVQFNGGKFEDAAAACDKSIAADPSKADPYFFKGAALAKAGKPGADEALNKYLQLDPTGVHATEAKTMMGQK